MVVKSNNNKGIIMVYKDKYKIYKVKLGNKHPYSRLLGYSRHLDRMTSVLNNLCKERRFTHSLLNNKIYTFNTYNAEKVLKLLEHSFNDKKYSPKYLPKTTVNQYLLDTKLEYEKIKHLIDYKIECCIWNEIDAFNIRIKDFQEHLKIKLYTTVDYIEYTHTQVDIHNGKVVMIDNPKLP